MKYEILVEDIIDSLDASVFNGDLFFNQENREDLRNWMSRWEKQLKEYDEPEYEDGPEFEGWAVEICPDCGSKVTWYHCREGTRVVCGDKCQGYKVIASRGRRDECFTKGDL